jgi:hypothetical protein
MHCNFSNHHFLWLTLMIISTFCLLQSAGGSWLTTVRQNSSVNVAIFNVFYQILFTAGTHADISTHDATDHQCCRWVVVLYKKFSHSRLVKQKPVTAVLLQWFVNTFWSTRSQHVQDRYKSHIIPGLHYVTVMCAVQCCSQLLLWPSQLCWH